MKITRKNLKSLIREALNDKQIEKLTNLLTSEDDGTFFQGIELLKTLSEYEEDESGESIKKDIGGVTALEKAVLQCKEKIANIDIYKDDLNSRIRDAKSRLDQIVIIEKTMDKLNLDFDIVKKALSILNLKMIDTSLFEDSKSYIDAKNNIVDQMHKLNNQYANNEKKWSKTFQRLVALLSIGSERFDDSFRDSNTFVIEPQGGMKFGQKDSYVHLDDPLMESKK